MKKSFFLPTQVVKRRIFYSGFPQVFISAFFIILGVAAAFTVMLKTPSDTIKGFGDAIVLNGSDVSVLSAYWKCSRYHIFTALLSTSFLGIVFIPALLVYRGFALCCTSAALIHSYENGAMLSAIILGVPGLITLPCLLIIASESMLSAAQLMYQRFGLRQRYPVHFEMRRVCLCLICLFFAAVFDFVLLPELISLLNI